MKVKNPSKILRPPACFPSRQSCLYIISPRWIICSKSTASTCPWEIVQNSPSHSTQNLKSNNRFSKWDYLSASQSQGTNESTMCHQESFWKKKRNPPDDCFFFFFELPPSTFSKVSFYIILPAEAFQFLLFQVSRCYFHMKLYEIHADLSRGWGGRRRLV